MISILELIRDIGWTGPIVTEIPATSVKDLVSNSKFATLNMLINVHTQLVKNITNIFRET